MAVKTAEELLTSLRAILGEDNNSDEVIELFENITDSVNAGANTEYTKEKFDALDRDWRKRYTERFMGKADDLRDAEDERRETVTDDSTDEVDEEIKVEDLFEKEEK